MTQLSQAWQKMSIAPRDGSHVMLIIGETIPDLPDVRLGQFVKGREAREMGYLRCNSLWPSTLWRRHRFRVILSRNLSLGFQQFSVAANVIVTLFLGEIQAVQVFRRRRAGNHAPNHFRHVSKMIPIGKGALLNS